MRGSLESFRSSFDPRQLDTWIVRLLAQVDRVPRDDVARLLANTYGGFLASRDNPKWRVETEERLEELLAKMLSLGIVEQDGDALHLTLLSRACGRSTLPFGSVMRLVDLLRRTGHEGLTPLKLMALLQVIPESDGGYTPLMKRGTAESVRQREAGLPAEALGILSLPVSLSRGEYLALHAVGISTPEQFWATPEESLAGVLGASLAAHCVKLRHERDKEEA